MPDVLAQDDVLSFDPSSAMVTTPPSAPPAIAPPPAVARPDLQAQIQKDRERSDAYIAQMEKSQALEEGNLQQRQREMEPLRQRALSEVQRPLPPPPKQEKPPEVPKRQNQHDDETWLFASALLGSLAGAFTRRHQTNALAAFSGAMEGYQEGSKQKFEQNMRIWEAENKKALETNKQAMDEYKEILQDRKFSTDQMSVAMQIAGQKYDDQAAITAAKTKNSLVMAQFFDKRAQAAQDAQDSSNRLLAAEQKQKDRDQALRIEKWKDDAEIYKASPDGQTRIAETLAGRRPPPSQSTPRNSPLGYREAAIADELSARGLDFGEFRRGQAVKQQRELIPGRVQAAGETAAARTFNVAGANIEIVMSRAGPVLTNAAEAANAVPATEFKRINQLYLAAAEEISDPAVRNFKVANEELAGLFAAILNPRSGVITVSAYDHARQLIAEADGPEAYQAILHNIQRLSERESANIRSLRAGGESAPINIPPISPNRRASVPDLARKTIERTTGATEGAAPGSVGRVEPSGVRIGAPPPRPPIRYPASPTPDMPIPQEP